MHGLFRVRGFTQDDAHIFCLPNQVSVRERGRAHLDKTALVLDMACFGVNVHGLFLWWEQVAGEIKGVLDLVEEVLSTFGFTTCTSLQPLQPMHLVEATCMAQNPAEHEPSGPWYICCLQMK